MSNSNLTESVDGCGRFERADLSMLRSRAKRDAGLAGQLVRSDAAASRAALGGRFARLSDGANGPGERDGLCPGHRFGSCGDSLAPRPVSGTHCQRVETAERNSGGQAVDTDHGRLVHRRRDCDRSAAVWRFDESVYATGTAHDGFLRGARCLRRLDHAQYAAERLAGTTEACRSTCVGSADRLDLVLAPADGAARIGADRTVG